MPKQFHLTIFQKREVIEKWDQGLPKNKKLSSRKLAAYFTAKWGRSVSKTAIQNILDEVVNIKKPLN